MQMYFQKVHELEYIDNYLFQDCRNIKSAETVIIWLIITIFFLIYSTRIRVGRSIEGFGLSPGITRDQRLGVEKLMGSAFAKLEGDLSGKYFPLLGMPFIYLSFS